MQKSKTAICNLALTHLNQGIEINDLEQDETAAARAFRRVYDTALGATLQAFEWPFASKQAGLALVTDDVAGGEWAYAYAYPVDCLHFRRILGLSKAHSIPHDGSGGGGRVPYKFSQLPGAQAGADVKVILTNQSEAVGEWTKRETDPSRYPDDFMLALSFHLAYLVAPRLGGETSDKLRQNSLNLFQFHLARAIARADAEEAPEISDESTFTDSRL